MTVTDVFLVIVSALGCRGPRHVVAHVEGFGTRSAIAAAYPLANEGVARVAW